MHRTTFWEDNKLSAFYHDAREEITQGFISIQNIELYGLA